MGIKMTTLSLLSSGFNQDEIRTTPSGTTETRNQTGGLCLLVARSSTKPALVTSPGSIDPSQTATAQGLLIFWPKPALCCPPFGAQ